MKRMKRHHPPMKMTTALWKEMGFRKLDPAEHPPGRTVWYMEEIDLKCNIFEPHQQPDIENVVKTIIWRSQHHQLNTILGPLKVALRDVVEG